MILTFPPETKKERKAREWRAKGKVARAFELIFWTLGAFFWIGFGVWAMFEISSFWLGLFVLIIGLALWSREYPNPDGK